ncbi:hypothetical protein JHK87_019077 [Glycine soja]|nr:hypothetical protein JHK87_019077 [Glycine soja]
MYSVADLDLDFMQVIVIKKENHHTTTIFVARKNRRDVLIGFGGLYGASTLTNNNNPPLAIAARVLPPDLKTHQLLRPISSTIIDFKLPSPRTALRVRPAAHLVNDVYIDKYREALERMKALSLNDPRNFTLEANVHCAYITVMVPITN